MSELNQDIVNALSNSVVSLYEASREFDGAFTKALQKTLPDEYDWRDGLEEAISRKDYNECS